MNTPNHTRLKSLYFYCSSRIKKGVFLFYEYLIEPKSTNEDRKRREFILNVLLFGAIFLSLMAAVNIAYNTLTKPVYRGMPFEIFIFIPIFFTALVVFSRKGFAILSSHLLLSAYFLFATYSIYAWGADLPQALLVFALLIILSGILISTKSAIFITLASSASLITISILQINEIIRPNLYWKDKLFDITDSLTTSFTFFVIAIVSWLSNRELEKSLQRARRSEADLQKERDSLEIKVEERTKEIKEIEAEKSMQLHKFAEFGKMASGLFHDLANPLTAAMLHMENIKNKYGQAASVSNIDLNKVFKNIEQVRIFTEAARKQIQEQETIEEFSLREEIDLAIKTLSFKASRAQVKINFANLDQEIKTCGNPVKIYRLVCDLLSNAIDAYSGAINGPVVKRKVSISLFQENNSAIINMQDWGCGIKQENLNKIFQPLFTTKKSSEGTGLGLYISKNIIEKDFGGSINVQSQESQGSIFTIKIPIQYGYDRSKCA